ncbi:hypothetical protein ACOMHN_045012 [Nucella lapillus]
MAGEKEVGGRSDREVEGAAQSAAVAAASQHPVPGSGDRVDGVARESAVTSEDDVFPGMEVKNAWRSDDPWWWWWCWQGREEDEGKGGGGVQGWGVVGGGGGWCWGHTTTTPDPEFSQIPEMVCGAVSVLLPPLTLWWVLLPH